MLDASNHPHLSDDVSHWFVCLFICLSVNRNVFGHSERLWSVLLRICLLNSYYLLS